MTLNLIDKLLEAADQWRQMGFPSRQVLFDTADRLERWKREQPGFTTDDSGPTLLTATLDDAMGQGLDVNGDAIYGTQAGPIQGVPWCRSTEKGDTVYLHVFDWPSDGRLVLEGVSAETARLLCAPASALSIEPYDGGLVIVGPKEAPDKIDTVVALG